MYDSFEDEVIDTIDKKLKDVESSAREIRKATSATKKVHRSCIRVNIER